MLSVSFTPEDLLGVTFATGPAPLMELVLVTGMVQRDVSPLFGRWQHTARAGFPQAARRLLELVPPAATGPMFLDPLSHGLEDGLDAVLSAPTDTVRAELDRVCRTSRPVTPWIRGLAGRDKEAWQDLEQALRSAHASLVAPSWSRVRSGFDAERAWRTRFLAEHGIRATLAGLVPGTHWRGTTLVFDCAKQVEVALAGHGLVLLPSLVWEGPPLVAVHDDAPSILIYPALTPLPLLGPREDGDPLSALLGRTRAAALGLLTQQLTTTDIARELDISKSSASEHAKALRDARLIVTQREGKAVWHSCTPLGLDLLTGSAAAP
ncbi:winged helix-turn-helix domain-containing protein [Streptomyces sp. NPDC048295]|uniref:ArsR/SmtB family transcription factor n=1 Tax=Streptomyces sp. NPDC048295 TaxID=3154617 RepID=UPI003438A64F